MTSSKKTIIFDFDGTIADTLDILVDIYNSIAVKYRCKPIDKSRKNDLRSKGAKEIFKICGVSAIRLPLIAMQIKRELRSDIKSIDLFDGIESALSSVKRAGYNLGIMTSNSESNVSEFLKRRGICNLFDFIYSGSNVFGKDKVIKKLLKEQKISLDSAIYVGDETRDIEAVKKINLPMIAVSWGFNSKEALSKLDPNYIIDSPDQLLGAVNDFFIVAE